MKWPELLKRSYVPYSGKPAACVIVGSSGKSYPGVRIENISFPITIHECQTAIFSCLIQGDIPVRLIIPSSHSVNDNLLSFWVEEYGIEINQSKEFDGSFYNPVLPKDTDIRETLTSLLDRAVVPNSQFRVSALLETPLGYIGGANIECREWQLGLCAERTALSSALSLGIHDYKSIHIYSEKGDFCSPCGACRQVLAEHMADCPVYLYHADHTQSRYLCRHLIPYSFTAPMLANPGTAKN